jgi:hypothetical protein
VKIAVTNFGGRVAGVEHRHGWHRGVAYAVTVTAQGGPFTGPVTLGCANLPAGDLHVQPAVVTPGASKRRQCSRSARGRSVPGADHSCGGTACQRHACPHAAERLQRSSPRALTPADLGIAD